MISFVVSLYAAVPDMLRLHFGSVDSPVPPPADPSAPPPAVLSTQSFKVLTECPLVLMVLRANHPKATDADIRTLLPLMLDAVACVSPRSVPPHLKAAFLDLKSAQVACPRRPAPARASPRLSSPHQSAARGTRASPSPPFRPTPPARR